MSLNKLGALVLGVVLLAFTAVFYGDVLFHPNDVLINASGDGLKNYYATVYHSVVDTSYHHFKGMNYPFGELAVYLDAQLSISNTIKFLGLGNYSVAIVNLLVVLSTFFCGLAIYGIFKELKLRPLYALLGAFSIAILQPQLLRTSAHFSLSYAFYIPIGIWLLLKTYNTKSDLWLIPIVIWELIGFFIHPYLGLILTLFNLAYFFFSWVLFKFRLSRLTQWVFNSVFLLTPVIFFKGYLYLLDSHVNRSTTPWGIDLFQASLESVFTPFIGPLRRTINHYRMTEATWEGYAYLGVASILVLIGMFILFAFRRYRNEWVSNDSWRFFLSAFLSSVVLLIWSFGVLVTVKDGFLLKVFPFLHQFRSLGRFAWPFYYVVGILGFFLINCALRVRKNKLIFSIVFCVVALLEGVFYHKEFRKELSLSENVLTKDFGMGLDGLSKIVQGQGAQCIIPFPFYYIGSDEYLLEGTSNSHYLSMVLSAKSGVPIMGGMSSRTSISEVEEVLSFLGPNQYEKPLLDKLDGRPLLIAYTGEELTYEERKLLSQATLIKKNNAGAIYSLLPSDLRKKGTSNHLHLDSLSYSEEVFNDSLFHYVISFDDEVSGSEVLLGHSSVMVKQNEYAKLASFDYGELPAETTFELSVWMKNTVGTGKAQLVGVLKRSFSGKNLGWITYRNTRQSQTILDDWNLVRFKFTTPKEKVRIEILSESRNVGERIFDNLIIREVNQDVYQYTRYKDDSVWVINNELMLQYGN